MTSTEFIQKILDLIPFKFRGTIKNVPILKQIQAFVLNHFLNNKEFYSTITGGPAKGLRFPIKLPQDKQIWIGTWELNFAKFLQMTIKPGWICYDIGAYKGFYSGVMALKGAAQVIAFEPMPTNIEKIKKLIELNPYLPIKVKEYAVADKMGNAFFKRMPEETMGKLEESRFEEDKEEVDKFNVQCVTVDWLIENGHPIPDFIKIDVEGAEELVLKGATKLIINRKPLLMIEIHSSEIGKSCYEFLKQFYLNISVFETGLPPQNGENEICHYIAN